MTVVLDTSAILAWIQSEPGALAVDRVLPEGVLSAVNWSEVLQKVAQHHGDPEQSARLLESLGVSVADGTRIDAEMAARLWDRRRPLSLADRFCLALGLRLDALVLTADRDWLNWGDQIRIESIR